MVKCQRCGQENDGDADFCESCGANLNPLKNGGSRQPSHDGGMKQSTKILIAVCILLVAVLGVSAAALSQLNKQPIANNTNTSNITVNSSANQNQSTQTSTKEISKTITPDQAASIALKYGKKFEPRGQWSIGSVDFIPASNYQNTANYMVELSNNGPVTSGVARAMDVRINAQTGTIMQ
jgi:uncharacterized membrane protein YkoI